MMKPTPEDDIEATDRVNPDSICEQDKITTVEAPAVEITSMEFTPVEFAPVETNQYSRKRLILMIWNAILIIAIVVICCVLIISRKDSNATKATTTTTTTTVKSNQNCGVPKYERVWEPASCHDILDDPQHPNSYWDNTNFLCRLSNRPCDPRSIRSNSNVFDIEFIYDFQAFTPGGAGEVWVVIGNTNPSACFAFRAEGHWYVLSRESEEHFPSFCCCDGSINGNWCESLLSHPFEDGDEEAPDVNDYEFGSLHCCEGSEVYIVVDGVLVDSCPHSVAEECRNCQP